MPNAAPAEIAPPILSQRRREADSMIVALKIHKLIQDSFTGSPGAGVKLNVPRASAASRPP